MTDAAGSLVVAVVIVATLVVVAATLHAWYAAGLSRVFRAVDADGWRAWIPVGNEAELLRLARFEPALAVLAFVPVVNVYGYVVHVRAVHRVGARFGLGVGTTVIGALLPPVWAMVVGARAPLPPADVRTPTDDEDDDTPAVMVGRIGERVPAADAAPLPAPGGGSPLAALGATPLAPAGPPRAHAAGVPTVAAPAAQTPPASESAAEVVDAVPASHDLPSVLPTDVADLPLRRRSRRSVAPGDGTTAAAWWIVTADGERYAVASDRVIIGRHPFGDEAGVQYLAIADATRTVSTQHAALRLIAGRWSLSDIGSTNGTSVVDARGSVQSLAAHTVAEITGEFRLGDMALRLEPGH